MTVQRGSKVVPFHTQEFERWRQGNLRVVDQWTADGLLHDIDPDEAQDIVEKGAMVFTCSDRKQVFVDILPNLRDWFLTEDPHVFGCHGGGVMLDPEFPYNREVQEVSAYWVREAREAYAMGTPNAILIGHIPCRRLWRYHYSAMQMVRSLIRGKDYLKTSIPDLKVAIVVQVDRGPECRERKRRVMRVLKARNFRPLVGVHRPDYASASSS